MMSSVLKLAELAQRFFSPNAAAEILSEFLPKFTIHSVPDAILCQGYLALFLPVEYRPTHTTGPQTYLPTLFSLWSMLTYSAAYDAQFTYLISRIAEFNVSHGTCEVGLFTKQQIQTVFTVGLKMMNLPVGTRSDGSSSTGGAAGGATTGYGSAGIRVDSKAGSALLLRKKPEKFKALARFIVYTIMSDHTHTSYTLSSLSEMIQATELYFHPSNHGTWAYMLTQFARHLCHEFLKRWREEQDEDCETPQERRLTVEMRKQFVLIMRPVLYLSMFGKDQFILSASLASLRYLAWLEPSLIFPGLLERVYPSLETLTETHRTTSALGILIDVAKPLFSRENYPAGGKHLLPLLHLAIPGIDMNDPLKTITSLMFVSTALMTISIMDMTQQLGDYTPSEDIENPFGEFSAETEDYLVKLSTAQFEEWLAKFMNRVFTIFENLPQENRKKQGSSSHTIESGLTQVVLHTCDVVFGQLSDELYDLALRLIVEFVNDRVLSNATRAVGLLCDLTASVNPKKAAKALIPLCVEQIKAELEHGASSTVSHSASSHVVQSDATFHWYQNILFSVVSNLGAEVLNYKRELIEITDLMIAHCRSRRGMMWTGKLIRSILFTLLQIYPTEFKSLTPSQWNDRDFMAKHAHQVWGQPGDPAHLDIQWHVPSEAEKDFALEFVLHLWTPTTKRLSEIIETAPEANSHEQSNELCRLLAVLRNCLMGSATMVADDGVEGDQLDAIDSDDMDCDDEDNRQYIAKRLEVGYAFTDPHDPRMQQARELRKSAGELIHALALFFKTKREDDVESIKIWIKIARAYLSERGVEKSQFERSKAGYSYAKNVDKTPLCKKRYPRNVLIRRAYNHHLLRLRQNVQGRLRTPHHDALLMDLLDFSLSAYAEIRKPSQVALSATARCFRGAKNLILPVLLDALKPSTSPDRMKGALYLFTHKSLLLPCLRDWKFIPSFITAICHAQHQDKLTIQELIRKVFMEYISNVHSLSFHVLDNPKLDPVLSSIALWNENEVSEREHKVHTHETFMITAYTDLMKHLLEFLQDSRVHWRFATMAANFVEVLLRVDVKPTTELAKFANQATLSELPTMRRIGVSATTQLLLYIKQRTIAAGNPELLIKKKKLRNPLKVQVQVKEGQDDLGKRLLQASFDNADDSLLVDDTTLGWYVWPTCYTAYKTNTRDTLFETIEPDSLDAFNVFSETFTSIEYWTKLSAYLSEEVHQKNEDSFSESHARLFSSIFQTFQDLPLEAAKPSIESLCEAMDQKNAQRAASEILAGLIRGTKHWRLSKLDDLWQWLGPVLQKVFAGITPDSLTYWESFVKFCFTRRDPRRLVPLMDILLASELDPSSDAAFNEARKLLLIRAMIIKLQWRCLPLVNRLLPSYLNNLQHPYKQVREVIGGNIYELLQLEWVPSHSSVAHLLEINAVTDGVGNIPTELNSEQQERVRLIMDRLDVWLGEMGGNTASSDYAHASKTILCWLHETLIHWRLSGTLPYIIPFLPKLFVMQEMNDDQDLQVMATRVLNLVAQLSYPPSMLPDLIDQFLTILTTSTSWHIRIRVLPVLQVFFFKHLFAMSSAQLLRIMEVISQMLLDTQIEVRQLASVTLGGLVRCSQRDAIQSLLQQFEAKMRHKIPKRKRDPVTGKNVEPAGFAEAVLQKHAGVLGLSCLINAFPYEVPEWMPVILVELADCISDPAAEIQATVRKTFSDFRRTHSDTWHEDMVKFNEDQLSILNDMLISPSYYA
ncbi:hypothetical protein RO3G_08856 [Rhizopus delemar RA 99-880]|uniref:Proteasome activator Blm10 mid region domain-containing protein n=3 Tax=Rhizopus TaxID=4842 RepID=I1C6R6_RHIO9|nr:hypothetical protein RO3G_08856 [Rhizopus delemar RA 99-880]|eukprot:EIE84146.1 hypothetical protein RO3G_08856 [Rhizopus delemar RA 99-880]